MGFTPAISQKVKEKMVRGISSTHPLAVTRALCICGMLSCGLAAAAVKPYASVTAHSCTACCRCCCRRPNPASPQQSLGLGSASGGTPTSGSGCSSSSSSGGASAGPALDANTTWAIGKKRFAVAADDHGADASPASISSYAKPEAIKQLIRESLPCCCWV